jgi:hypothetical protein
MAEASDAGDVRMTDIEHEVGKAGRASRPHREAQELEITIGAGDAEQLHAGLRYLSMLAGPLLTAAKHGAFIAKPHGEGPIGEPRRGDARDLRRHVGAQRRHFARLGLHETQDVARIERAEASLENIGKLERGRGDKLVTVQGEVVE